ncbi:MAG: SRPBCC family protein [Bacteroidota bacterium]
MSQQTVPEKNPIKISGNVFETSRVFNAPISLVFEAWTNPEHFVKWWGPTGFTTTNIEFSAKPGGVWRHIMHGPDGTDYPNKTIFREVIPPVRLSYTNGYDMPGEPELYFAEIDFMDLGNQTEIRMRMTFKSAEELQRVAVEHGAIEGNRQHLDRLDAFLTEFGKFTS